MHDQAPLEKVLLNESYIDFKDKRYQDNLLNRYTTLI